VKLRSIVVLLLLANAGFFAWSQWIVQPASVPSSPPPGGARLVLGSEAPSAPPLPALRLDTDTSCVSLGPFLDLTEAARASSRLREAGLGPRQRAADGPVWAGYWVSMGGIADADAAEKIIERLRQSGIGDAYIMPGEEAGPTISLGLFTERPRAMRRADEIRALGYRPEVAERQRSGTVYWIDVDIASPEQLPDPATYDDGSGRIFRLQVQPCDPTGQVSQPVTQVGVPDGVPG
jgi:hypothetical protein